MDASGQARGERFLESKLPPQFNAESLLLAIYSYWSEEFYAAGFMHPDAETVAEFRRWMKSTLVVTPPLEDYEREFLEEFRRQELGE